jgi:hypothetical protein
MTCNQLLGFYGAYAQIAKMFGGKYQHYRPAGADSPLNHKIGSIQAAFDTVPALTFKAPAKNPGFPYYGAMDARLLKPSDYLVGPMGTFFVAAIEPLKPVLTWRCTRTINILEAGQSAQSNAAPRVGGYSEPLAATNVTILTGWPANIVKDTRGELDQTKLPSDTRSGYFKIMLPPLPIEPIQGMYVTDDSGSTYIVSSAQKSWMGWELLVMIEQT